MHHDACDQKMKQLSQSVKQLTSQHDKESLQQLMHMIEFRTKEVQDQLLRKSSEAISSTIEHKRFLPGIYTNKHTAIPILPPQKLPNDQLYKQTSFMDSLQAKNAQVSKRLKTFTKSVSVSQLVQSLKREQQDESNELETNTTSNKTKAAKNLLDLRIQRTEVLEQISDKLNLSSIQKQSIMSTLKNSSVNQSQPIADASMLQVNSQQYQDQQNMSISQIQETSKTMVMMMNEGNSSILFNSFSDSVIGKQKLRKGKLSEPRILPKELRENPFATIPVVRQKDLNLGVLQLVNQGLIPKNTDILPAFISAGAMAISTRKKQIFPYEERKLKPIVEFKPTFKLSTMHEASERYNVPQNNNQYKDFEHDILQNRFFFTETPAIGDDHIINNSVISMDASTAAAAVAAVNQMKGGGGSVDQSLSLDSQDQVLNLGDLSSVIGSTMVDHRFGGALFRKELNKLEIIHGIVKEDSKFIEFKNDFQDSWGCIHANIIRLQRMCKKNKVKVLYVDLDKLAFISTDLVAVTKQKLINSCVLNAWIVKKLLLDKGRKNLILAAVTKIRQFYRLIQAKNELNARKKLFYDQKAEEQQTNILEKSILATHPIHLVEAKEEEVEADNSILNNINKSDIRSDDQQINNEQETEGIQDRKDPTQIILEEQIQTDSINQQQQSQDTQKL